MEETRVRIDAPRPKTGLLSTDRAVRATGPAPDAGRRSFPWRRLVRWAIGGAMLAEAGWLLVSTVLFRTSVRATITAPMVSVRVPQAGAVRGTPPPVGTAVTAGQPLFEVETEAPDRRPSEGLRAEVEANRRSAGAIRAQIAELDALKDELGRHFRAYCEARTAQAEKQAAEQAARVEATAARLRTAESEQHMHRRLSSRGAASEIELARAESTLAAVRHELEVERQAGARLRLQLDAARRGIFVGEADGGQDRVASRQRCDEIEIQQAGLRARLGELDGRLEELRARLASEDRHLAAARRRVVAPIDGVVWSSALAPGAEAPAGETAVEIVDPRRLRIEAFFKESDAGRVRPGVTVKARVVGSPRVRDGRVVRVSDPGVLDRGTIAGAVGGPSPPGTFRALIDLGETPGGDAAADPQEIGRSVVVWTTR